MNYTIGLGGEKSFILLEQKTKKNHLSSTKSFRRKRFKSRQVHFPDEDKKLSYLDIAKYHCLVLCNCTDYRTHKKSLWLKYINLFCFIAIIAH